MISTPVPSELDPREVEFNQVQMESSDYADYAKKVERLKAAEKEKMKPVLSLITGQQVPPGQCEDYRPESSLLRARRPRRSRR